MKTRWIPWPLIPFLPVLAFLLLAPVEARAQPKQEVPLLLDTDIGNDMDDAFALALILASPEVHLRGITTVSGNTQVRALLLCRFLTSTGRRHTAVAAGARPQPPRKLGGQYQYYYHPDVIFHRTRRPVKQSAVEFMYSRLQSNKGKVSVLATGPLTNLARLLTSKPECKPWIHKIILTAGSGAGPSEANLAADIKAARTVFASGIPLVVVPAKVTAGLNLDKEQLQKIFEPGTALTLQVQALYQLQKQATPHLADALTTALCFEDRFSETEKVHLSIDDKGTLVREKGKPNAQLVTSVRRRAFLSWYTNRLASCLPPVRKPAKVILPGKMPYRVHVAEDFETDIERRWWMNGKAEKKILPPESTRACRGVLTHDFDDLLGNPRAMYTAVIFNPVPGPPMGKNTRLRFRYWLKGTDQLRVQIYSLSKGYHRHLVLKGLPQGRWQSATVDMTVARRPDGTGGPLSEGERIDDIQFYTDPQAELIIDDIVLYDAATPKEQEPFPAHLHFAAWFDSGKQGKEWPGDFTILRDKGFYRHAAQSVSNPATRTPWIRLHLRGKRPLGTTTHLSFRYHLTGTDQLRVVLRNSATRKSYLAESRNLKKGQWAQTMVAFSGPKPSKGELVDEIQFLIPKAGELLLDDVLLYEPGK